MDDEEQSYSSIQEPLYRVETGNYEYRLVLRCRQEARAKFAKLRNDVLEKIELLEAKHAQNLADNLIKLLQGLAKFTQDAIVKFESTKSLFPIEVDLRSDAFTYKSQNTFSSDGAEEEEVTQAEEAKEEKPQKDLENSVSNGSTFGDDLLTLMSGDNEKTNGSLSSDLIPGIQNLNVNQSQSSAQDLLSELGLDEIDLTVDKPSANFNACSIDDLLN